MMEELFRWRVTYDNGTHLDEAYAMQGFASVDQAHIKSVELFDHSGELAHQVSIPDGATGIFFRRRSVAIDPVEWTAQRNDAIHCIGWKNEVQTVYLFILADGSTLLSSDLQAV